MGGGGGRRAYKAGIDRLQELQPQLKYGNDNESLNVQEDVMSSARFYMMSLYDKDDFEGNLYALRAHLFCNINEGMSCHQHHMHVSCTCTCPVLVGYM